MSLDHLPGKRCLDGSPKPSDGDLERARRKGRESYLPQVSCPIYYQGPTDRQAYLQEEFEAGWREAAEECE